jgi:hypothetical protein
MAYGINILSMAKLGAASMAWRNGENIEMAWRRKYQAVSQKPAMA